MITYILSGILFAFSIILWIMLVKKEIEPLWKAVVDAKAQMQLHQVTMKQVESETAEKGYAQEIFKTSYEMHRMAVKKYNRVLMYPFYYPIAWLLGYRKIKF